MNEDLLHVTTEDDSEDTWVIKSDGFFKRKVENNLLQGMTQDAVDMTFSNAARILSHCPNPYGNGQFSKTGIIIGKVQSGKTSNFISVLALALDNDYKVAVVLGGNTKDLLTQNAVRIQNSFNVETDKLVVLKTGDNDALITASIIKEFTENGRKVIIVGLKHTKHINLIAEIFNNSYLSTLPVLIIDDEGDQATLNTKAYRRSMSETYKSMLDLKKNIKRHCLLSITATPQANILIETFDKLSPDFGELVYPGEGYCGLQEFHGNDTDKYVYEIPDNEESLLDSAGVPNSAKLAMAMFFVGNAIRMSRGDSGNHAMLIHPSQKKSDHEVVVSKLQSILEDWKDKAKVRLAGRYDISYDNLRGILTDAYNHFKNDGVICGDTFDKLELSVLDAIRNCSPILKTNSDENASSNASLYKTNIFVGGNLVERGITIKGLAVTYITRRAKTKANVDNVEQRARWFGYKQDYLDVCRIFAKKSIKDDFTAILEHDEDLWSSIERAQERGIDFKDIPRIFLNSRSSFLNLTRRNVAKTAQYDLSEWKPQKYYITDSAIASHNREVISTYMNNHANMTHEEVNNSVQQHLVLEAQSFGDVYDELLSKLRYKTEETVSDEFFKKLSLALDKVEFHPLTDVVWVRYRNHSTRKILDNDMIQQLFQGRNPNTNSESYYGGDQSLSNKHSDRIQIQIHFVKPTNRDDIDFYSPVIAIFVPNECSERLSKLVVRES